MSIKKNSICKIALSAALVLGGTSLISTHPNSTVHAESWADQESFDALLCVI